MYLFLKPPPAWCNKCKDARELFLWTDRLVFAVWFLTDTLVLLQSTQWSLSQVMWSRRYEKLCNKQKPFANLFSCLESEGKGAALMLHSVLFDYLCQKMNGTFVMTLLNLSDIYISVYLPCTVAQEKTSLCTRTKCFSKKKKKCMLLKYEAFVIAFNLDSILHNICSWCCHILCI